MFILEFSIKERNINIYGGSNGDNKREELI
jgi:hypothetical protein